MTEQETGAATDAKKALGHAVENIDKRQYLNALYCLAEATRQVVIAFGSVLKKSDG